MLPELDPLGPLLITDMIGKVKNHQVLLTLLAQGVKIKSYDELFAVTFFNQDGSDKQAI